MKQLLIWAVTFASCFLNNIYCDLNNYEDFDHKTPPKGRIIDDDSLKICPSTENSKHPVYIPHPTECNKFYVCDRGNPHLKICKVGLHFNPKLNVCDYPKSAGCDKDPSNPKEKIIGDDNLKVCPSTENSKHPVYVPHPTECNKFYICNKGNPHLKTCQVGLHFNPKLNVCDYPKTAGCDKGAFEKPNGKAVEDEDFSLCPAKNTGELTLIPHPSDCNKFYICDYGTPRLQTCPSGLYFNEKIRACDFSKNVDCNEG